MGNTKWGNGWCISGEISQIKNFKDFILITIRNFEKKSQRDFFVDAILYKNNDIYVDFLKNHLVGTFVVASGRFQSTRSNNRAYNLIINNIDKQ